MGPSLTALSIYFSPALLVHLNVSSFEVISGWQLVRPRGSTAKGDSADPYVVVEIFGVPPDCAEERTRTVKNDSFNPSWEESFQFQVGLPEVAILRWDWKGGSEKGESGTG